MSVKYKVLEPGFFNKMLYSPTGKRRVLTVDKPFPKDKMPSWLELIKASAAVQTVDEASIKVAMLKMIEDKEGLNSDDVPNVAPLERKVKCKVGQELRDKVMAEIKADEDHKQGLIESGQKVSFTSDTEEKEDKPSKVKTL